MYNHHHHHHHIRISVMELGHSLIRSGLKYPEVSSKVYHDSYCQLGSSVSLPWVILRCIIQGESLARGPKLLSMYTVEQRGFLFRKYWQTGSFKACQRAFRTEFGERRAPSKCCIQKLVKKVRDKGKPI